MIKFIPKLKEEKSQFTYIDVSINQFFVKDGCLCMYNLASQYIQLTKEDGSPYCVTRYAEESTPIDYPLPEIERIEY